MNTRGILKKNSYSYSPSKTLQWDEDNLRETEKEKEEFAHIHIDEPKTPFVHHHRISNDSILHDSLNLDGGGSASEISDTHSSSVRRVSLRTSQVPYYQALVSSGTEWSSDELSDADSELESRAEEGSPRVHNSFTSPSFTTDGMDVIEHFETLQDKLKHEEFIHHRQLHYNMKQDLDKAKKLLEQEFLDDNDDED